MTIAFSRGHLLLPNFMPFKKWLEALHFQWVLTVEQLLKDKRKQEFLWFSPSFLGKDWLVVAQDLLGGSEHIIYFLMFLRSVLFCFGFLCVKKTACLY